jgi:hypothetical protein
MPGLVSFNNYAIHLDQPPFINCALTLLVSTEHTKDLESFSSAETFTPDSLESLKLML